RHRLSLQAGHQSDAARPGGNELFPHGRPVRGTDDDPRTGRPSDRGRPDAGVPHCRFGHHLSGRIGGAGGLASLQADGGPSGKSGLFPRSLRGSGRVRQLEGGRSRRAGIQPVAPSRPGVQPSGGDRFPAESAAQDGIRRRVNTRGTLVKAVRLGALFAPARFSLAWFTPARIAPARFTPARIASFANYPSIVPMRLAASMTTGAYLRMTPGFSRLDGPETARAATSRPDRLKIGAATAAAPGSRSSMLV